MDQADASPCYCPLSLFNDHLTRLNHLYFPRLHQLLEHLQLGSLDKPLDPPASELNHLSQLSVQLPPLPAKVLEPLPQPSELNQLQPHPLVGDQPYLEELQRLLMHPLLVRLLAECLGELLLLQPQGHEVYPTPRLW